MSMVRFPATENGGTSCTAGGLPKNIVFQQAAGYDAAQIPEAWPNQSIEAKFPANAKTIFSEIRDKTRHDATAVVSRPVR
jgi:hypothetical protein